MNYRFSNRNLRPAVCSLATVGVVAIISILSMYIITLSARDRSVATTGLVVLVKTQGADDSPKGRQLNWYVCPCH